MHSSRLGSAFEAGSALGPVTRGGGGSCHDGGGTAVLRRPQIVAILHHGAAYLLVAPIDVTGVFRDRYQAMGSRRTGAAGDPIGSPFVLDLGPIRLEGVPALGVGPDWGL